MEGKRITNNFLKKIDAKFFLYQNCIFIFMVWSLRSLLGLIIFLLSVFLDPLCGDEVFQKSFYFTSSPFSYADIDSVTFFSSESGKELPSIQDLLHNLTQDRIKIIGPSTSGVDVRALIADLQFVIDLSSTPAGNYVLVLNGLVGAKNSSGFIGKVPVYSRLYLFKDKSELLDQLKPCLRNELSSFLQAYTETHPNYKNSVFYVLGAK